MPKRSNSDDDSDYLRRKIRKMEKKLERRKSRLRNKKRTDSSSSSVITSPVPLLQCEGETNQQSDSDLLPIIVDENELGPSTSHVQDMEAANVQPILSEPPTETVPADPELDDEILNLLGETPSKDKKFGSKIQHELAIRLEHIATSGLGKDCKKELLMRHLIPENCTKIDAPKLNPEIKAALSDMLIKKDKALENKQMQQAAAISCIADALTQLFSSEHRDQAVIKSLIEASRLLCDSQHTESMTRRSFICSTIKKDIKDHLYNTDIDNFLFGEKLTETLKAAKAISKSGAEIKLTTAKKNATQKPKPPPVQFLNPRPPLPPSRLPGATRRSQPAPAPMPAARQWQQQPPRPPPRSQQRPVQRR